MNAELGSLSSQSVLVALLIGYSYKLIVARLQIEVNGKVMAADRSFSSGVEGILAHNKLAVLVVYHNNNASNVVVEEIGTLRVVVVAEV